MFLKISQNSQENTCVESLFNKVAGLNFVKKETLPKLFYYEFCEIFGNTFFYRIPLNDYFSILLFLGATQNLIL